MTSTCNSNDSDNIETNGYRRTTDLEDNSPASSLFAGLDDEDNILEYFLGGTDQSVALPPTPEGEPLPDQSVAVVSSSMPLHLTSTGGSLSSTAVNQNNINSHKQKNHIRFSMDEQNKNNRHVNFSTDFVSSTYNGNHDARGIQPPVTPAVQHFYARPSGITSTSTSTDINGMPFHQSLPAFQQPQHPKQQSQSHSMLYMTNQHTKANSSVSPLVFEGTTGSSPIMHIHHQFQIQPQPQPQAQPQPQPMSATATAAPGSFNNLSPISPAAICTSEVMMLPPPSNYSNGQSTNNSHHQWQHISPRPPQLSPQSSTIMGIHQNNNQNKVSDTTWLQHLNHTAMNATSVNGSSQSLFTSQQHQQPTMYLTTTSHCTQNGTNNATNLLSIPPTSTAAATALLHHMNTLNSVNISSPVESKEKRERRLARNRESARQSRRRKKELLINLEAQVNKLQTEIETERRRQLDVMERDLFAAKESLLNDVLTKGQSEHTEDSDISTENVHDKMLESMLVTIVLNGGPNINVRRAAVEFQYNALRQLILPYYQRFFLAISLQEESFFIEPKERMKSQANKVSGRISSKLVGEEISKKYNEAIDASSQNCRANDGDKVWPLLCYELSISLDQEDKLLHILKIMRKDTTMPKNRTKTAVAVKMISSLLNGVLHQSQAAAQRNEVELMQILTPEQVLAFFSWLKTNKERCSRLLFNVEKTRLKQFDSNGDLQSESSEDAEYSMKSSDSLSDLCKQLNEAMMIAKSEI